MMVPRSRRCVTADVRRFKDLSRGMASLTADPATLQGDRTVKTVR